MGRLYGLLEPKDRITKGVYIKEKWFIYYKNLFLKLF